MRQVTISAIGPLSRKICGKDAKTKAKLRMPTATARHRKRAQAGVPTNSRIIRIKKPIPFRVMTNGLDMVFRNMRTNIKQTLS